MIHLKTFPNDKINQYSKGARVQQAKLQLSFSIFLGTFKSQALRSNSLADYSQDQLGIANMHAYTFSIHFVNILKK